MQSDSLANQEPTIVSFSIRKLFGRRSYNVEVPLVDGKPSRLLLLHGDNGSGKTTLLRILWHTLSASEARGHRTYLAQTPFAEFSVTFTQGRQIRVEKKVGLVGAFSITLTTSDGESTAHYDVDEKLVVRSRSAGTATWSKLQDMLQVELNNRTVASTDRKRYGKFMKQVEADESSANAEASYLAFLASELKVPLYLADDRSLYSDDPEIDRTREVLSRRAESERPGKLSRLVFIELQVTFRRVNEYLRSLTLGGQNDGSANSNAIYMNVLRKLVESSDEDSREINTDRKDAVETLLDEIAEIAPAYEQYQLVPKFEIDEFRGLLAQASGSELAELSRRVVSPFLSSLRARYTALEEAQGLLQALVPSINSFLSEKSLEFSPRSGLRIVTSDGDELQIDSLSSGERQLLTLLCTTVLARIDTNIFIVDEPELSLGVEWQRNILDSLLELTDGTGLQFLIATHSIEIISSHPEALVQLKPL